MITQTITNSFVEELLRGVHDFSTDTFKIALYTANADLGADTLTYIFTGEVVSFNYTPGGIPLTGVSVQQSGGVSFITFNNAVFQPAGFTARGALIYNATKSNKSVAVLDFGDDKVSVNSFTVQMPPATATSALIRVNKGV